MEKAGNGLKDEHGLHEGDIVSESVDVTGGEAHEGQDAQEDQGGGRGVVVNSDKGEEVWEVTIPCTNKAEHGTGHDVARGCPPWRWI